MVHIMVTSYYQVAVIAAIIPLFSIISAFILPLLTTFMKKRASLFSMIFSEIVFVANSIFSFIVFWYVFSTREILTYMFAAFPAPFGIMYEVDYLGAFMGLLIGFVFPLVNIVTYRYLNKLSKHNEWYYTLYLGLEAGLFGIVYTGDLFNLFVMLEVLSITAYGLTAYLREKGEPLNAAIKYGLFGAVGSTMYFIAVVLLYGGIGTLSMADAVATSMGLNYFVESIGTSTNTYSVIMFFAVLAVWAFLIESAIFPHHFWLPDAYSNMPAPAAATMAAVAEGAGVYVIIRIIYTITGIAKADWLLWVLILLGSSNIIVGGYLMSIARDLKKMIAYSTILDMGYVIMGVGLASKMGLQAVLYYVLAHAIVKPLLFIAAGEVEAIHKTTSFDILQERGCSNPWILAAFIIGGLAIIGLPPTNIFFAKLALFEAVLSSKLYPLAFIILVGSAFAFVGFSRTWYVLMGYRSRKAISKGVFSINMETKLVLLVFITLVLLTGLFYGYISNEFLSQIVSATVSDQYREQYVLTAYKLFRSIYYGG